MSALPIVICLLAANGDAPHEPRDLTPILAPILEKSGLPALGAAIVTSDGLEAIGAVGLRSSSANERVTASDQWHLGSCTKAMTATLVARLIARGDLSWDTTVGDVFGESMPAMDPAWSEVTIEMLLCHRSGASLNLDPAIWQKLESSGGTPREQRLAFARDGLAHAPDAPVNSRTTYSNAGFMIAGAMIEEIENATWEELMQREVFGPLGMNDSGFGAPGTPDRLDQPLGHTRAESGWRPIPLGPDADNPAVVGPAGTVHATLGDWARFARAHLRGERGDESFLKSADWESLHALPEIDWSYSPGWMVTEAEWADGKLLRHLGSNTYWVCEISLAPKQDVAVLIVTNVGDDAAEKPFAETLAALVADHAAHRAK